MLKFSQRRGITPVKEILQVDSIDDDLRNSLWTSLTLFYWNIFNRFKYDMGERTDIIPGSNLDCLFIALWIRYFKKPIDEMPRLFYGERGGLKVLKQYFFGAEWYRVYDFIEFVATHGPDESKNYFTLDSNKFLERENSAFRFVDGRIMEIGSQDEIDEIETAISESEPFYGVKQHLGTAISMLGDRTNPDYRNSIKESISAVECLCRHISDDDKATLGNALKTLESNDQLHPALQSAFNSLYGYTNDADGIRHALMEKSNLNSADARFMLISCSAFINYIIATTGDA